MPGADVVSAIIAILTAGITGIASAIGPGMSALVDGLFFYTPTGGTTTMSTFAVLVCCFAGIALALSLCFGVVRWLGSLGGKKW